MARSPRYGRVRLVARVDDDARRHRPDQGLPGARDRRQVGRGPAASPARPPSPERYPIQPRNQSSTVSSSWLGPDASRHEPAVDVHRRRDEVAQRPRPRPGARDVAEEARVREVPDERQDIAIEPLEELVERDGSLGRRPVDQCLQVRPRPHAEDGLLGQVSEPVDEEITTR